MEGDGVSLAESGQGGRRPPVASGCAVQEGYTRLLRGLNQEIRVHSEKCAEWAGGRLESPSGRSLVVR